MASPGIASTAATRSDGESVKISPQALKWLREERRINSETLVRLPVASGSAFFPDAGKKLPAIFFGYADGWKARSFPEKHFVSGGGFKRAFWNLERVLQAKSETVYIVEGEPDVCAFVEAGISADEVLGAQGAKDKPTAGDPKEMVGYAYVEEALEAGLSRKKKFVWCGDGDGAGHILREDMVKLLGAARFWFIEWPEGIKDANDMLLKDGAEALRELVRDGSLPWPVNGIYRLSELPEPAPMVLWEPGFPEWEGKVLLAPRTLSVVTGHPGHGKALALDTPIPTPIGWSTMGDLKVGDVIFDEKGARCRVTLATPVMLKHPCHAVVFDDGSRIVADADHIWETHKANGRAKRGPSLVTTKEISTSLMDNGKRNHAIVLCGSVDYPRADLLIEPYTLGAWLGDGSTMGAVLHSQDPEIAAEVEKDGYKTIYHANVLAYRIKGLQGLLRFEGLLGDKHIPDEYLRSDFSQRMRLLQGLMDTDGFISSEAAGYQCEYTSVVRRLANGVLELALSLGLKARITVGRAMLEGRDCGEKYRILFRTKLPVFCLPRKVVRLNAAPALRIKHRYVESCNVVPSVPVRCIQVDSPSRLYLAGKNFIPTHNTFLWNQVWFNVVKKYGIPFCGASFETRPKPHVRRQLRTLLTGKLERDMEPSEMLMADKWINDRYLFLVHPDQRPNLEWFLDMAEVAVVRHGARILQCDPWNRLEGSRALGENETDYILRCLRTLYSFAIDMNCHIQIVAHPSKMEGARRGQPPMLEDLAGSKHWDNVVDQGFTIHRPKMFEKGERKTEASFYHRKARFEELGYPCKLNLDFKVHLGKYVSVDYAE